MNRSCPKCGAENGPAAIHCRNCGAKLPEPVSGTMLTPQSSRRSCLPRTIFWMLLLMFIGAGLFWARENVNWNDLSCAISSAWQRFFQPEPPPAPVPTPPKDNVVKIRCPRCHGIGHMMQGDEQDRCKMTKNICILCNGAGGRTIVLPAGAEICQHCQGMGKIVAVIHGRESSSVPKVMHGRESSSMCKMCDGKGYIIRKY